MRWAIVVGTLFFSTALTSDLALAQANGTITGQVRTEAGRPLSGAEVAIGGLDRTATTGAAGRYTITGVPAGTYRMTASAPGYGIQVAEGVVLAAGQTQAVDFQLTAQRALELEGIVAVGYGTQRRRDVTGAIASVTAEDLQKVQVPTVTGALQGRVAGVQVTQASSRPGGGVSIRIRGSGSLSSTNEPLYVVDGVPMSGADNNDPTSNRGRGVDTNPLAFLNPEDIESIEVLKDASSTAIYGARGTNGVVLITTKKGTPGISRMEFESSVATQSLAKQFPLLNGPQFAQFANEWVRLRGESDDGSVPFPDPNAVPNIDYQDLIYRDAPMHEHNVSVLGGTDRTRFAVSGNFLDQKGIVKTSEFQRYSLRANVAHEVASWLNLGTNLNVSRMNASVGFTGDAQARNAGSAVQNAMGFLPILPIFREDGEYNWNDRDFPETLARFGVNGTNYDNPVGILNETVDNAEYDRVLGNVFAEFDLLEGLSLRLNGGANLVNNSRDEYFTRLSYEGGKGTNGAAETGVVEQTYYLGEAILNYNRNFAGLHDLDIITGFTYETEEEFRRRINSNNFPNDITQFFNIGAGTPTGGPRVGTGFNDWALASYLGRVNYGLANKYLFTVTGRFDGSSKFGAENKWGFFPSAAFAWRASEEPFFAGADWLSDLKLRVSYGQTGNQEIGTYQSLPRLANRNYNFGGNVVAAYVPASVANPELRWEKSEQFDAGFDAAFLDNRFTLTFDVYNKETGDLLLRVPLPFESGFNTALQNLGSVRNRGVELALGADVLDPFEGGLGWRTQFNIAHNRTKVLEIGDREEIIGGTISGDMKVRGLLVREGLPMGVFHGYETAGIIRDEAEAAAVQDLMPGAVAGQIRFVDQNGDGQLTEEDRTILGNPDPDFIFGWSNDMSWGPVSLYTFFQGTYGNEVYNVNLQEIAGMTVGPSRNIYAPRFLDSWTPDNRDATWPIITLPSGVGYPGPGSSWGELNDMWIEDGSYLRLKNVTLSYDLPERWANRLGGMSNARIFLNGENLLTMTSYRGFNPDVNVQGQNNINRGIDLGGYPLARTYRIGMRLGL